MIQSPRSPSVTLAISLLVRASIKFGLLFREKLVTNPLSRRQFLRASGLGTLATLASGCAAPLQRVASQSWFAPQSPPLPSSIQDPWPVPEPSLAVKIGQMIMVGFRGTSALPDSLIAQSVRDLHLGSVVLFSYNVESPAQVANLTSQLQAASRTPLLIAVDQEGGMVSRLGGNFGLPSNYSAYELGRRNDLATTRSQSDAVARQLASLGINLNLAPVVDLNVNPGNPIIGGVNRSYSADAAIVTAHAKEVIESHHQYGILCTLKHFPGHGSSHADSHLGFVDVTKTWQAAELIPYEELIDANLCDAIMTAHIFNAAFDPIHPATLSPRIISELLRKRLGYDGVVISDDLQMQAIAQQYEFETAVRLAIEAGIDILAIGNNLAYAENWASRAAAEIHRLVEEGVIPEARIDQSYRRIMRMKRRLMSWQLDAEPGDA